MKSRPRRFFVVGLLVLGIAFLGALYAVGRGDSVPHFLTKPEWDSKKEAQMRGERIWEFFNARPVNDNAFKILFVGNSITVHPGREGVWDSIQGMAASSHRKDYLHRFAEWVQKEQRSQSVEVFIEAGPGLQHALSRLRAGDLLVRQYDIVVLQRGENDKIFDAAYRSRFDELVSLLSEYADWLVVLSDWFHHDRAGFQAGTAAKYGATFVDLTTISSERTNIGDGGPYQHPGVARHPNDAGMAAIAGAMSAAMEKESRIARGLGD
jgi:hypothetical protein